MVFQTDAHGLEFSHPKNDIALYLNGRVVPCSTLSTPAEAVPGVWFAEAQAATAENLKEGDELVVMGIGTISQMVPTARLILHAREPQRGGPSVEDQSGSELVVGGNGAGDQR